MPVILYHFRQSLQAIFCFQVILCGGLGIDIYVRNIHACGRANSNILTCKLSILTINVFLKSNSWYKYIMMTYIFLHNENQLYH